jgi:hypothetical protein
VATSVLEVPSKPLKNKLEIKTEPLICNIVMM